MTTGIIVQARMSSSRLPGKMLRSLEGKTLIEWVTYRLSLGRTNLPILVATSTDRSDDLIARECDRLGIECFRGNLEDVRGRFADCMTAKRWTSAVRICGDSPLISPDVVDLAVKKYLAEPPHVDLVSNVVNPTYPKGQSVEVFSSEALSKLGNLDLTESEAEHVTLGFYNRPEQFRIESISLVPSKRSLSFVIDTLDDWERLRGFIALERDPSLELENLIESFETYSKLHEHRPTQNGTS